MSNRIDLAISVFFIINIVITVMVVILERKRPEKTIAWLLIIVLLPPLGVLFYIFLGRNWKRHKLNNEISPIIKELINHALNKIDSSEYISLIELLGNNSDSPIFVDNDIEIYKNGIEKFDALKCELLKARHHIHMEYYIVKNDIIGNEIKDILIRKSQEGVKVKFILDRVGSIKLGKAYIAELITAGVEVLQYSYFLAPLLRSINTQINYRNHRKIVVIDGITGFIGGINIGDEYLGKSKLGYWRDTHLMVKGDFVLGLQAVFLDDYITIKKALKEYTFDDDNFESYFPICQKHSGKVMQLVKSGPDSPFPAIMQGTLKMISMAKHHIYITTPYFVPNESIMEALKIAALSGIEVKIVFPGKYDHFLVYYASRTFLYELMKCGAKVYLYDKNSFVHAKTMTIDSKLSSVGTANMDMRSHELNYEINAVIYDEGKTQELEKMFYDDISNSVEMTIKYYESLPKIIKLTEAMARTFSSLL
ncbi:MAG: cardiolipin synthase [Lutispora sp.]|nr:cardiolipin synthase [Lutispora sp.]MDD4834168.1 cardiolipin synthase [Lutispora sp.]